MSRNKFISILILGLVAFTISAYLSVTFYKERIAFGDAAYQLFSILQTHDLAIQVMRFGSAITQVFPLAGYVLHLDLQSIALLYSLSFEFISIIAFILILVWFRNAEMALVLVLLKTLITSHTFFWVQSELLQGLVFLIVYLAWLKNKSIRRFTNFQLTVFFVFIFTLAFFHPLLIFPFLFCLLYISFFELDGYNKNTIHASVLLFLVVTIIKSALLKNAYDSSAMSGLRNFKTRFPNYLEIPVNKQFLQLCTTEYYFLPIVLLFLCILWIWKKNWSKLCFTLCFTGAYLLLIQITSYEGVKFYFRIESFYIPLAFMLAFVFMTESNTISFLRKTVIPFCFITLFFFVFRVEKTSAIYTQRLQWNKQFITKHLNEKLVIRELDLPKDTLLIPWAFTYETWILSTIEQHQTVSFAVSADPHSFDWTLYKNNVFITSWGIFEYKKLSPRYFIFQDNPNGYKHYDPGQ